MNDTLGPDGIVPTSLVYGEYPAAYTRSEIPDKRPTLEARSEVENSARREMERETARMKIQRALKQSVPSATKTVYEVGETVLVWSERVVDNRIGEWLRTFVVKHFDPVSKIVHVQDHVVGPAKPFNISQVKPYLEPISFPQTAIRPFFTSLSKILSEYPSPMEDETCATETLYPNDPRTRSIAMSKAKREGL